MLQLARKIFGTKNEREIKRIRTIVARVNELEARVKPLSDQELAANTVSMKQRAAKIPALVMVGLIQALERLVQLYETTNQKEKADDWRRQWQQAKAEQKKSKE